MRIRIGYDYAEWSNNEYIKKKYYNNSQTSKTIINYHDMIHIVGIKDKQV